MAEPLPIRRQSERLPPSAEAVLAALPAATLAIDHDGFIRYANAAAEQLFQSSATALDGEAVTQILPPKSPVAALIKQAIENDVGKRKGHASF